MTDPLAGLSLVALIAWIYLVFFHGRFWQAGPVLIARRPTATPAVAIVIPARNEAALLGRTLASLLAQDYAGPLKLILVDDESTDGTGDLARAFADPRLTVITGAPRPDGWSGKLWAVQQGLQQVGDAELVLLTDADIVHDPSHVATLVAKAEAEGLDMVSEMVRLACDSAAERALVPAFVFFFQLLYPFEWVNDPRRRIAAAAGGTILIRRQALRRTNGVEAVRSALIDDVALATAVKRGGPIFLGHAALARSIRAYPSVAGIWRMITRTAYVQLRFSPLLLAGTTLAMALVWLVPPAATLAGGFPARTFGVMAWVLMAGCYLPTLRRFGRSAAWAPFLPPIAAFYMAATIASALQHHLGRGVAWKGRAYRAGAA